MNLHRRNLPVSEWAWLAVVIALGLALTVCLVAGR